jgi:predicted nucleic acid-binding protein
VILIDTGPLVALCDARDSKHRTALKHLESFAANRLVSCDAVLTEACFHLPHRTQRQRLGAFLKELNVEPVPITEEHVFWLDVLEWLGKYADHEPGWADACLAVLSGRHKDLRVWTYDREFRTTWRCPNGTAIPLAVR